MDMESSPLTKAHDHALAAAIATRQPQSPDTTVAVSEHTHAAGEFANAALRTSSVEALRTLKLLEEHHRKLAELLSLPSEQAGQQQHHPAADNGGETTSEKLPAVGEEPAAEAEALPSKNEAAASGNASPRASQKTGLPQQRRIAAREMSSSIASNLASARGIRSSKYRGQPLSPSISNEQAPGNLEAHPRRDGSKTKMQNIIEHQSGKPSWTPPMPTAPPSRSSDKKDRRVQAQVSEEPDSAAAEDTGGYARFYQTFGSLMNRISAPLAFAGLPLIQEESTLSEEPETTEAPSSRRNHPRPSSATSQDVDLSKIYSKATMRAFVKEGHAQSDSFYVVPPSGHTMSYANILNYSKKEERRLGASHTGPLGAPLEDEDDDFVDARETPVPLSADAKRRVGRARTERELNNTIEELYTENQSLKDLLDKLTKRLHAFEASAQNMAESYRIMRPGSPLSSGSRDRLKDRDGEEEQLAWKLQAEKLERENKRLQKTLDRYRDKWETLKAGAKARREAQGGTDSVEDTGPS